jgi:hypothetical protein
MRRLIGCEPSFNVHRPEGANDFRSIQLSIRAQRFSGYVKGDCAMPNIKNIVTTLTLGGLLAGGAIGLDGAAMAASAGAIGSVNAVSSARGWTSDWGWGWGSAHRGGHFTTGGCHWRAGERFHARIRCGRHHNRDININGLAEDPLAIVRQFTTSG